MKRLVGRLAGTIGVLSLVAGPTVGSSQTEAICAVTGVPSAPTVRLHNNPPPRPTLLSPADATRTTNTTPTFAWTIVRDPEGDSVNFQLQVDDSPDFDSPAIDSRGHAYASFTPERPLRAGTYCWRVRSIDDIEASSPYSAAFELTITTNAAAAPNR